MTHAVDCDCHPCTLRALDRAHARLRELEDENRTLNAALRNVIEQSVKPAAATKAKAAKP